MAKRKPNSSSSKPPNPAKIEAGKKGGAAGKGEAKARSSDQARAAVNARWERFRKRAEALKREGSEEAGESASD